MRVVALVLCLLASGLAGAQIYKYTDANGNTAYSNQPPNGTKGATEVQLQPLNTVTPGQPVTTPAPAASEPAAPPARKKTAGYSRLELTGLPSGEALRANNGTFTVGVALEPKLQPGHMLQLVLDGNAYGTPSNVPRLQLVNIDRGEHNLSVQVLNGERVLQQSQTVTFTVQRAHR